MAPYFRAMLDRFEQDLPGFDVNVGNLPYCVLPDWAERVHHGGEATVTQACDDTALEPAVDKYEWHYSMRRHPSGCEGCVFRPRCSGVYGAYLERHGDGEFRAVTPATLRAARDGRRARRRARGLARALQAFTLAPSVGLSYSSSAVDGVVSDENTQNGLLGAGWTLELRPS